MLWLIIILLFLILLAMLGGGAFIHLITTFISVGVLWLLIALIIGDIAAATKMTLSLLGILFVFIFVPALFAAPEEKTCPACDEKIRYKAKICKHCGCEQPTQKPRLQLRFNRDAIARQFRMPQWSSIRQIDYAGALVMVVGIAIFGFLILYIFIPR